MPTEGMGSVTSSVYNKVNAQNHCDRLGSTPCELICQIRPATVICINDNSELSEVMIVRLTVSRRRCS